MPHLLKKGGDGRYHKSSSASGHGGNSTAHGRNMPHGVRSAADFDQYRATQDDWDGIRQALYDTAVYPAAGIGTLQFFNIARGAGISWTGTGTKNYSDTNMQLGGQLAADQRFLMESIEVQFFPCLPSAVGFFPANFHTAAGASWINDQWVFRTSGNLELDVASKPYLNEAPLMVFPSKCNFCVEGALSDSTTAGAGQFNSAIYANAKGRPYIMHPYAVGLDWGEAFAVTLNWPEGNQAMPSGKPGLVKVRLDGILQRKVQ